MAVSFLIWIPHASERRAPRTQERRTAAAAV